MIELQTRFINRSGKMVASDPAVGVGGDTLIVFDHVRKGVWIGTILFDNQMFLKTMMITHEDSRIMKATNFEIDAEIISGQFGFFDLENYRNDEETIGMPIEPYDIYREGDVWYCAMSYITSNAKGNAGGYDYGIVTEMPEGIRTVEAYKSIDNQYVQFIIRNQ